MTNKTITKTIATIIPAEISTSKYFMKQHLASSDIYWNLLVYLVFIYYICTQKTKDYAYEDEGKRAELRVWICVVV